MEFWGVEVKNGESLKVTPGEDMILHITQAYLGIKQGKENEPVCLFAKWDDQKIGIGILSTEKFPQISLNLVFEKEFELCHSWRHGSVFFTGHRERNLDDEEVTKGSDDDSPINAAYGRGVLVYKAKKVVIALGAGGTGKIWVERKGDNVEDEEDPSESDESDEDSGDEDEPTENDGEAGSSEESEDEETARKPEAGMKRTAESSEKTPVPEKKAKLVTPHKTDGRKGGHVHIATPYPSKQAGKQATGEYSCKPSNRSFKTQDGLRSRNRAKHSA